MIGYLRKIVLSFRRAVRIEMLCGISALYL